jgi:DNA helicase-2/ATP-dependent DNA helicase PcrA
MEEGLFPHSQSMNSKEDLEEERRLCYVGITRARRKLFLTWTPFRRSFGADSAMQSIASRFLNEMPLDLIEGLESGPAYLYEEDPEYRSRQHHRFEYDEDEDEEGEERVRPASESRDPGPSSLAELRNYIQQQARPAKPADSGRSGAVLKSGMRVRHAQFGDGIILSRERVGNDIKLVITFSRVGRKTLMEKYAKLQAL